MYRHPLRVLAEVRRALWRKLQWRLFAAFVVILIAAVSVQTITADFFAWRAIVGYVATHRTSARNRLRSPGASSSPSGTTANSGSKLSSSSSVLIGAPPGDLRSGVMCDH